MLLVWRPHLEDLCYGARASPEVCLTVLPGLWQRGRFLVVELSPALMGDLDGTQPPDLHAPIHPRLFHSVIWTSPHWMGGCAADRP